VVSRQKSYPASGEVEVFSSKLFLRALGVKVAAHKIFLGRFASQMFFCKPPLEHVHDGSEMTRGRR
jgi:hypothetical protein